MRAGLAVLLLAGLAGNAAAQGAVGIQSGVRPARYVIRNALVLAGNGTPASGPYDIVIEGNTIANMVPLDPVAVKAGQARRPTASVEIDATGKYVMPGLINAHGHVQDSRGGLPQPLEYELKLWLACGVTTVRDVGSVTRKTLQLRAASAAGTVAAPRILVYGLFGGEGDAVDSRGINTAAEARARVRELKAMGVDGIKIVGIDQSADQAAEKAVVARTATVEVTPEQAQKLILAQQAGSLSLALRSVESTDNVTTGPISERDLGNVPRPAPAAPVVRVVGAPPPPSAVQTVRVRYGDGSAVDKVIRP